MSKTFNAKQVKKELVQWIKDYFEENGPDCNAVIGISGGKDSSVAAALCVEALGKERVIGILMPQGEQSDISCSHQLCEHLGIKNVTINIGKTVDAISEVVDKGLVGLGATLSNVTTFNTPARIRMTTLYGVAGSVNGRVVNTCNLSEDWVGYATKFGDGAGDFSPLMKLTVSEVKAIGYELNLPTALIEKTPIDGLCGKTDEDNLGFTYEVLDRYIRTGVCEDETIKAKIDKMHAANLHKLLPMPHYTYIVA